MKVYEIEPVSKPRMTKSDKWKGRPCVKRFFSFRDEVRLNKIKIRNEGQHVIFYIPMPKSWTKKKKTEMLGRPHQQKPDLDNFLKAFLDAVFDDDSKVYDIKATKYWSEKGAMVIK